MPEQQTKQRASRARREGKAPSTQAGEFVREEIEHIREGKHGGRSPKQAIAIGLSKARRAGVPLPAPKRASRATKRAARRDAKQAGSEHAASRTRSRATREALRREPRASASPAALSKQASTAASRRSASERSAAARKAARTKGPAQRKAAARKAARSRATHT
jgi:hypothetical protein